MSPLDEAGPPPVAIEALGSVVEALRDAIGASQVFVGDDIEPRHRGDLTGKFKGAPHVVVRPGSTEEVAEVVRIAAAAGVPITPYGGGTGLVGVLVAWCSAWSG